MISFLPIEVIQLIIEQVGDIDTLDGLCEATRFTDPLFHVAISRRWKEVQIKEHDFLVAPHDCDRPEHSFKEPRKLFHTLLEPSAQGLAPVASHVRVLSIDLKFDCTPDLYGEPYEDDFECLEDVTYEDIDYSFSLLIPNLCSLGQLNLDGPLYQGQLERITQLQSIQILKLRHNNTFWPLLRRGHERFNGGADLCLQWDSLAKLSRLCHLEIGEIVPDEAESLGNALVQLDALRKLVIAASHNRGVEDSPIEWHGTEPGSLDYFVKEIFIGQAASHTRTLLPPNLLSIALVLSDFNDARLISPARTDVLTPLRVPRELYLECLGFSFIQAVLTANPLSNLSSVWLPARALESTPTTEQAIPLLCEALALDQLHLFDIETTWDLPLEIRDVFSAGDLVLGAKQENSNIPGSFTTVDHFYTTGNPLTHHIARGISTYNPTPPAYSWDKTVQRLLVDHNCFLWDDAIFKAITPERWWKLRILIVRPWFGHETLEPREREGKVSWCSLRTGHTANEAAPSAELLARQIVEKGLPELQVLVLGSYWFWISRANEPLALRFSDARSDPDEAQAITDSLSQHDWNFLLDMSRGHTEEEFLQTGIRDPDALNERTQRKNYLSLYRKDKDKANDEMNQWRGRPFGQGTTVLSCPAWRWMGSI